MPLRHRIPLQFAKQLQTQLHCAGATRHVLPRASSGLRPNSYELRSARIPFTLGRSYAIDVKRPDISHEEEKAKKKHGVTEAMQDLGHGNMPHPTQTAAAKDPDAPDVEDNLQLPANDDSGKPMQGRLVSTPSRLLKLLIPLRPPHDSTPASTVPLTLILHPSQPLSYVERLLQAELPVLPTNPPRPPDITFLAHDPDVSTSDNPRTRFSAATEVGDFLRSASRHHVFYIQIEASATPPLEIRVPSFRDRTFYLRARLRAASARLEQMSALKNECDALARRGAQRVAGVGFAGLVGWWASVWYCTFHTSLGWDVMEPVTYLAGLSGVISGYLWFLWHNREVSYRSVLHLTVSRRQMRWYEIKGFDLEKWKECLEEVKEIRREIRKVAMEYDAEWEEAVEGVMGGRVKKVLEKEDERKQRGRSAADEEDEVEADPEPKK